MDAFRDPVVTSEASSVGTADVDLLLDPVVDAFRDSAVISEASSAETADVDALL